MNLFTYLIPISLAAVTLTLFVGLFALFRGGDFGRSYSNKLMRLRVLLQAVAILVLVGAVWWRHVPWACWFSMRCLPAAVPRCCGPASC